MEASTVFEPASPALTAFEHDVLDALVLSVQLEDGLIRAAEAEQYRAVELMRRRALESSRFGLDFALRSVTAELATALHIHEMTAAALMHEAEALVSNFPQTLDALESGLIARAHVREVLMQAGSLPEGMRTLFESAALPLAAELTPGRFRREARRLRERMHPDALAERLGGARANRRVVIETDHDGMSWLSVYLPSAQAAVIGARLEALAVRARTEGDERTRMQLETDIVCDLLVEGTIAEGVGSAHGTCTDGVGPVRPTVFVTVPALTLLGRSDEPGTVEGHGPIDAETARALCGNAPSFFRILTEPESGTWLSYGRDSYAVPADLKRYIRLRDGICRFPGCTRPAVACATDHTNDWQFDGLTAHDNLASLCLKHHRLKHNSAWKVSQLPRGVLRWTSPAGLHHDTRPDSAFGGAPPGTTGSAPPTPGPAPRPAFPVEEPPPF